MNQQMQIIHEVNMQAEMFYDDAIALGDHAANALKKAHRSQMTGLENIANSTLKVSDVLDYIKRQTARFSYWRQGFALAEDPEEAFGERLKDYLEKELARKRDTICGPKRLNIGDKTDVERALRRRVHLFLIRQFLRQMIIQYEFRLNVANAREEI